MIARIARNLSLAKMLRRLALPVLIVAFLLWQNWAVNAQSAQHGITVTWGAVTTDTGGNAITVDGYRVYRGTTTGQATTLLTTLTATSYKDSSGTAGTRYFYVVTSYRGAFESAKSSEVSAVFVGDPKAPAGVSAIAE